METQTNERAETRATYPSAPRVDVWRRDGTVTFEVELPGVTASDVALREESGVVVIEARRAVGDIDVRYQRRLRIGDDLDPERIEARIEHGVLTVTLPPRDVATRTIPVNAA